MLVVSAIGPQVVHYFLDGRDRGTWSDGARELLHLTGPPQPRDLRLVLQGRDPANGDALLARRRRRHRAGWDLVFAAPKSLSLVTSRLGPGPGESMQRAHRRAVDDVTRYLEGRLRLARSDPAGGPVPAEGLIAATFRFRRPARAASPG